MTDVKFAIDETTWETLVSYMMANPGVRCVFLVTEGFDLARIASSVLSSEARTTFENLMAEGILRVVHRDHPAGTGRYGLPHGVLPGTAGVRALTGYDFIFAQATPA